MNRLLLGGLAALLMVSVGLFWLQGRAEVEEGAPPPEMDRAQLDAAVDPEALPTADVTDLTGPAPPEATEMTREQRRFARYDRDRDGRITRNEMLSTRTSSFRSLDTDGNNLLTFEEWAVKTVDKFGNADANGDNALTPREFASTRPKKKSKSARKCNC